MKTKVLKLLLASAVTVALLNGCIGQSTLSSPSAQVGTATGALAGAVLAANHGKKSGKHIAGGTVLGALVGGLLGNAVGGEQAKQTGGWQ